MILKHCFHGAVALALLAGTCSCQHSDEQPAAAAQRFAARVERAAAQIRPPEVPVRQAGEATAAPSREKVITVSAIGDCAIGELRRGAGAPGSFADQLSRVAGDPLRYPFSGVAELLQQDDLTIGNLEGTLTAHDGFENPVFSVRGKPEWAKMLVHGGVDVVNVENNHSHDYGPVGHKDTKSALAQVEVEHFGYGQVDRRVIKGVNVVNLGYLGGPERTKKRAVRDVRREKQQPNTLVIVSFHWGIESYYATHPEQRALGKAVIDAGADLVLGHHPHVLQGLETYRGKHIVYSLGNFVFGANSKPADMDSMIYQEQFTFVDSKLAKVENRLIPVRISTATERNDYRPVILEGAERQRVLDKIAKLSAELSPSS